MSQSHKRSFSGVDWQPSTVCKRWSTEKIIMLAALHHPCKFSPTTERKTCSSVGMDRP